MNLVPLTRRLRFVSQPVAMALTGLLHTPELKKDQNNTLKPNKKIASKYLHF